MIEKKRNEFRSVVTRPKETPGIDGGIFIRKGPVGHVNTVDVPAIDDYLAKVEAAGGKIVLPKRAVPGVGWHAYCTDSEGSIFGVMRSDPNAS